VWFNSMLMKTNVTTMKAPFSTTTGMHHPQHKQQKCDEAMMAIASVANAWVCILLGEATGTRGDWSGCLKPPGSLIPRLLQGIMAKLSEELVPVVDCYDPRLAGMGRVTPADGTLRRLAESM